MQLPPNLTGNTERRLRSLPSERINMQRPRSIVQAIAAGLQLDPAAEQAGFADGTAGVWRLTADDILEDRIDVLAYVRGWLEGKDARKTAGPRGG
jgi:hypothetical protein